MENNQDILGRGLAYKSFGQTAFWFHLDKFACDKGAKERGNDNSDFIELYDEIYGDDGEAA